MHQILKVFYYNQQINQIESREFNVLKKDFVIINFYLMPKSE